MLFLGDISKATMAPSGTSTHIGCANRTQLPTRRRKDPGRAAGVDDETFPKVPLAHSEGTQKRAPKPQPGPFPCLLNPICY